jgi:S1-C subfamily serine protease
MQNVLNAPLPAGIYVNDVEKDFPANKSGIKAGYVLYKVNNFQIDQFDDVSVDWGSYKKISLGKFLNRVPLNEYLKFSLYRNEKQHEITFQMTNSKFYPNAIFILVLNRKR